MKIKIDEELCIGCGLCATVAPQFFKVGDDEKAKVIMSPENETAPQVLDAMASCPVNAITED